MTTGGTALLTATLAGGNSYRPAVDVGHPQLQDENTVIVPPCAAAHWRALVVLVPHTGQPREKIDGRLRLRSRRRVVNRLT